MSQMMASDRARLRWASVLLSALTATAIGGGAVAQEPTPQPGLSATDDTSVPSPFPTAEEVGEVLSVEVGIRSIEPGLSQLWEGIEFDPQELPSAYVGIYRAPPFETDEPIAGAIIDVAEFETVDDAMRHADEKFADWPAGFETDLNGDHVFSHTFPSEDFDGSFIVLRDGSVVVVATAMTSNGTDTEAASEALVELVLSKLHGGE